MSGGPPIGGHPKKKRKPAVPRFARREADRAYQDVGFDRAKFLRMARYQMWLLNREVRRQAAEESLRNLADAVDKFVSCGDKLDGIVERDYKRREPFIKIAAELQRETAKEEESPRSVVIRIGSTKKPDEPDRS